MFPLFTMYNSAENFAGNKEYVDDTDNLEVSLGERTEFVPNLKASDLVDYSSDE